MTKIVARVDALDMTNTDLSNARNYSHHSLKHGQARFFDDANNYTSFIGSGLVFEKIGPGLFIDGTIAEIHSVVAGVEYISATGFSLDAWELEGLLRSNDSDGLWDSILRGDDVIKGSSNTANGDVLLGNVGDDRIFGKAGNDTLKGEFGNDRLSGGPGGDFLYGGPGNDYLDGGRGGDILTGGPGKDSFVFSSEPGSGNGSFILDFKPADDSILLSHKIFAKAGPIGALSPALFHDGHKAHDANDRIIYDHMSGTLSYDKDGNGPHAAVVFAFVYPPQHQLTDGDFIII
jgi:Ca2+-binding RTX toxin-like protein